MSFFFFIMNKTIKTLTVIYLILLIVIIVIADIKGLSYLLDFVQFLPYSHVADKLGHFVLFGISAFLVNLSLGLRNFKIGKFCCFSGSLIILLVITVEELSQIFLSGRTFSLTDLLCGYAGVFTGGELARLAYGKRRRS